MRLKLCVVALFASLLAAPAQAEKVTVLAASSLKDVLHAIAADYPGELRFSFAASSAQARQVELGAPADLIISANAKWIDYLNDAGLLDASTIRDIAGNRLVVVGASDTEPLAALSDLPERLAQSRLALADPKHVPAGIYAREALISAGVWPSLESRIAPALDVRAALLFVKHGEVDMGIVYASDLIAEPSLKILLEIPPALHSPIRYVAALPHAAQDPKEALAFLDYLSTAPARQQQWRFGFTAPD